MYDLEFVQYDTWITFTQVRMYAVRIGIVWNVVDFFWAIFLLNHAGFYVYVRYHSLIHRVHVF